jgi:hypothetical protein
MTHHFPQKAEHSVDIATDYGLVVRMVEVRLPGGGELGIFLFDTVSRPVLGPNQPPIQRVSRALSLIVK